MIVGWFHERLHLYIGKEEEEAVYSAKTKYCYIAL